jgi:hypothetical protein
MLALSEKELSLEGEIGEPSNCEPPPGQKICGSDNYFIIL